LYGHGEMRPHKPNRKADSEERNRDEESYEFQRGIDSETKIRCSDFSLECSRSDIILVRILKKDEKGWREIGSAKIAIEDDLRAAGWGDIELGLEFRNKGIGSKVVQFMLEYLKQRGIKEVHGGISRNDDVARATNFWKKNGFEVTSYEAPREGVFVTGIFKRIA
jgi:GNAT superfamily N-acetyltransferase